MITLSIGTKRLIVRHIIKSLPDRDNKEWYI